MSDPLREAAEVMRRVRAECPWSQRITHRDLVPYLIEEAHEVIDAVEGGMPDELREELGDLLWQVLFHAAIAAEVSEYDIDDVARGLTEKMVRRHPHVFGDAVATTPEQVLVHWNAAKAAEKRERRSVLDGVPRGMPALALAQKLLGRAGAVVERPSSRFARSEAAESRYPGPERGAERRDEGPASESELGDALLALVAHASANGWDAERALRERLRLLEDEVRAAESGA